MAKQTLPSPEVIRQLLRYDPETGALFWRERPVDFFAHGQRPAEYSCRAWNRKMAGKRADTSNAKMGYIQTSVFGQNLLGHRIIWAIMTGSWPTHQIDHINGKRDDNRWCNLRAVENSENCKNKRRLNANTSGVTGVYYDASRDRWCARINGHSNVKFLGRFIHKEDAVRARKAAEKKYGYHENHGRAPNPAAIFGG